jgi:hypothetical protein
MVVQDSQSNTTDWNPAYVSRGLDVRLTIADLLSLVYVLLTAGAEASSSWLAACGERHRSATPNPDEAGADAKILIM